MKRIRGRAGKRQQARIGAPDRSLTANAGLAAVTELCDRLGVIGALDAAVGPVKQRDRGFGAGGLLAGIAAAQLAGEDFLTGLDRQRAGAAGQLITPVPGLASTTAAGLARRVHPGAVAGGGVRPGSGDRPGTVAAAGGAGCGAGRRPGHDRPGHHRRGGFCRKKRGVAYNHQGQRVGRPHVAAWAETEIVLAADLGDGTDDPRATAPDLLRRALAALPHRVRLRAGWRCAPTPATSPGSWPAPPTTRRSRPDRSLCLPGPGCQPAGRRLRPGWHGESQPPGPLPQAGERPDRQGHRS